MQFSNHSKNKINFRLLSDIHNADCCQKNIKQNLLRSVQLFDLLDLGSRSGLHRETERYETMQRNPSKSYEN